MMVWEYYAMIYVRARGSIALFPRAALALFLVYHFYYFCFPAGFHVLALVTMFFFLVAVMVSEHTCAPVEYRVVDWLIFNHLCCCY